MYFRNRSSFWVVDFLPCLLYHFTAFLPSLWHDQFLLPLSFASPRFRMVNISPRTSSLRDITANCSGWTTSWRTVIPLYKNQWSPYWATASRYSAQHGEIKSKCLLCVNKAAPWPWGCCCTPGAIVVNWWQRNISGMNMFCGWSSVMRCRCHQQKVP